MMSPERKKEWDKKIKSLMKNGINYQKKNN